MPSCLFWTLSWHLISFALICPERPYSVMIAAHLSSGASLSLAQVSVNIQRCPRVERADHACGYLLLINYTCSQIKSMPNFVHWITLWSHPIPSLLAEGIQASCLRITFSSPRFLDILAKTKCLTLIPSCLKVRKLVITNLVPSFTLYLRMPTTIVSSGWIRLWVTEFQVISKALW